MIAPARNWLIFACADCADATDALAARAAADCAAAAAAAISRNWLIAVAYPCTDTLTVGANWSTSTPFNRTASSSPHVNA